MAQRVAATLALGCILVLIIVHAEATDRLQAQRSGQRSWQRSWQRSAVELQADGHGAASASSGAAGHPHSTRRRTLTATGSTGVPAGAPIPHIIHHMHKNINALDATQAMLRKVCQELHPDWEFKFWTDDLLDDFVRTHFAWHYKDWSAMHPRIKQLDTSRYMLMHHFGGVYLDVDVECVRNMGDLVAPLPRGAAWVGDFPEPMFLASAQGNRFWLHMLRHVKATWEHHDAWHSTGPAGLNDAFASYLHLHGHSVLVPFLTQRTEKEFHEFIKDKNGTVPYYMLANGLARLEGPSGAPPPAALRLWHSKEHYQPLQPDHQVVWRTSNFSTFRLAAAAAQQEQQQGGAGAARRRATMDGGGAVTAVDERVVAPEGWRIGFLANELLDPAGCGPALGACKLELCKQKWPLSYLIHHCLNTWRGRIGDTRRR